MYKLNKELTLRRENLGLSQRQMATLAGVSISTISEIESETITNPRNETLRKLFTALAESEGEY